MARFYLIPQTALIVHGKHSLTLVFEHGEEGNPLNRSEREKLVKQVENLQRMFGTEIVVLTEEEINES